MEAAPSNALFRKRSFHYCLVSYIARQSVGGIHVARGLVHAYKFVYLFILNKYLFLFALQIDLKIPRKCTQQRINHIFLFCEIYT